MTTIIFTNKCGLLHITENIISLSIVKTHIWPQYMRSWWCWLHSGWTVLLIWTSSSRLILTVIISVTSPWTIYATLILALKTKDRPLVSINTFIYLFYLHFPLNPLTTEVCENYWLAKEYGVLSNSLLVTELVPCVYCTVQAQFILVKFSICLK